MKIKSHSSRWAKLQNIIRIGSFPVLFIVAMVCALTPTRVNAETEPWGPERPTFTWQEPADYVTFNSITDNPLVGNERNFVRIREAGSTEASVDDINLEVGKEYEVSIWFHNNAKSRLNREDGVGIARNVRLLVHMPENVEANTYAMITATISADNANPQSVWDSAYGYTDSAVALRYVPNSATIYLDDPGTYDEAKGAYFYNGHETTNGKILDPNAMSGADGYGGVMLGYWEEQWGTLPGCNEYAGYVKFRFVVDQPNFEMYKTVSKEDEDNFNETVTAKPGDVLEFKIEYKNTGTTYQDSVVVVDTLPEGLTYIPNSTYFSSTDIEGKYVDDGYLFGTGLNLGNYAPGDTFTVTYKARVEDDKNLFPCGDTVIYNEGKVGTQNGTGIDRTEITVNRTCDCSTNPEMEGCQELPHTGPVEVAIATLIIGGIGGAGYYFYSTRRTLKTVKSGLVGGNTPSAASDLHHRGEEHHHTNSIGSADEHQNSEHHQSDK